MHCYIPSQLKTQIARFILTGYFIVMVKINLISYKPYREAVLGHAAVTKELHIQ